MKTINAHRLKPGPKPTSERHHHSAHVRRFKTRFSSVQRSITYYQNLRTKEQMQYDDYMKEALAHWKLEHFETDFFEILEKAELIDDKTQRAHYVFLESRSQFQAYLRRNPDRRAAIEAERAHLAPKHEAISDPVTPPSLPKFERAYDEQPITTDYYAKEYAHTMAHAQPKPTADPTPCRKCRHFLAYGTPGCDYSHGTLHVCLQFSPK